ncbi:MAG: sugar phosphate nucleotidyltransferase, partial [Pseudomonas sp.]
GVVEILTVTNRELLFKTEDEYRTINKHNLSQGYILEPFGRNTAAAVAAAALQLLQSHGPQAHMLVLAADHLIQNEAAFSEAVSKAVQLAGEGWLVTFGIKPQYPETGFGYIEAAAGGVLEGGLRVERFVEKPDAKTAEAYVAAGNYFWNAGMFCFQVGTVIEQFKAYAPDVLEAVERTLEASRRSTSKGYSCLA